MRHSGATSSSCLHNSLDFTTQSCTYDNIGSSFRLCIDNIENYLGLYINLFTIAINYYIIP